MIPSIIGPLSDTECDVLAEVASASAATSALEVGHYLGLSTAVLLDSLPEGCSLVTIDHHQGDRWCPPTSADTFLANVEPFVGDRPFEFLNDSMADALPRLSRRFDFCFYDADHTAEAVAEFWGLGAGLLADRCTLAFDDADWSDQSTLRSLAEADGFAVVTDRPFVRSPDDDKGDPATYTLEVMRR